MFSFGDDKLIVCYLKKKFNEAFKNIFQFRSCAHFITDERGEIDLAVAKSIGGSYTGCYPMGLFTSLSSINPKFRHLRLQRVDPREPWEVSSF